MTNDAPWDVRWAAGALEDLLEIVRYILENDSVESAREFSAQLKASAKKHLAALPYRGHAVPELENAGQECREIHVRAYRVIYQPAEAGRTVWILMAIHGRRNIKDMLLKRLLHYPGV